MAMIERIVLFGASSDLTGRMNAVEQHERLPSPRPLEVKRGGASLGRAAVRSGPVRRPSSVAVVLVHAGMPLAAGDHIAVGEESERIGDREAGGDARVDQRLVDARVEGPGTRITTRLSITSMIVIEIVSAARAVEMIVPAASPARTSGLAVNVLSHIA